MDQLSYSFFGPPLFCICTLHFRPITPFFCAKNMEIKQLGFTNCYFSPFWSPLHPSCHKNIWKKLNLGPAYESLCAPYMSPWHTHLFYKNSEQKIVFGSHLLGLAPRLLSASLFSNYTPIFFMFILKKLNFLYSLFHFFIK